MGLEMNKTSLSQDFINMKYFLIIGKHIGVRDIKDQQSNAMKFIK